jgi:hypothetical protein
VREADWTLLLNRIRSGSCTPFLGAGACFGTLPLAREIASRWASEYEYPLADGQDLARVAQFVGVAQDDAMVPKERMRDDLEGIGPPDFAAEEEPHAALAELPLPVFLTTNYDDFMVQALRRQGKDPRQEICRWNGSPAVSADPSVLLDDPSYFPTPAQPLVYHLHGRLGVPESMVLTEDDYLDFLVAISRDAQLLPHQIQRALAGTSLLFVGYGLTDWNFRVIHRGLVMNGEPSLRRLSVTVQLHPALQERAELAQDYLDRYFGAMKVRVYWGTAAEFVAELRARWREADGADR